LQDGELDDLGDRRQAVVVFAHLPLLRIASRMTDPPLLSAGLATGSPSRVGLSLSRPFQAGEGR
jgi:hypothetical protein